MLLSLQGCEGIRAAVIPSQPLSFARDTRKGRDTKEILAFIFLFIFLILIKEGILRNPKKGIPVFVP